MADDLMNLFDQFDEIFHTTYRWRIHSMIWMKRSSRSVSSSQRP